MFKKRKTDDITTSSSSPNASAPVNPGVSAPEDVHPQLYSDRSAMRAEGAQASVPKDTNLMSRSPFPMPPTPAPSGSNAATTVRPGAGGAVNGASPRRDSQERRTLVVGRGISVQGSIQDAERLVVEGTVEAKMLHAIELSVPVGGVLRGEIEVEDADLAGTIDGTVTVRGNLTVRATGRLIGKTRFRRLQVEDGGQITGHLEMITTDPGARGATSAPQATASVAAPTLAEVKS